MSEHPVTAAHEAIKTTPALVGTGYTLAGLPLSEWAALLTAVYVILQMILLLPRYTEWYKSWRSKRASSKAARAPRS